MSRRYQAMRLALLHDLTQQTAGLEVATGLGGLAVAAVGAPLVLHGWIAPTLLPLLVLVSIAAFLPVSEIAQVGRQLADTIASTRRLHVVHSEPVAITDGTRRPSRAARRLDGTVRPCALHLPGRQRPRWRMWISPCRPVRRWRWSDRREPARPRSPTCCCASGIREQGGIKLDGVDLRELTLDGLRSRIALVAQDTYLFNDTLEANVRLAQPDATREQIDTALRQAALAEFVADLPEGLQTRVGERGVQLSGGQRQRIAIARAFLKDAPILVLDEATSHLDTISEQLVRSALDALMANRTTIVVAHRLSTIQAADVILVLNAGRVIEAGTHAELDGAPRVLCAAGRAPDGGGGRAPGGELSIHVIARGPSGGRVTAGHRWAPDKKRQGRLSFAIPAQAGMTDGCLCATRSGKMNDAPAPPGGMR